MIKERVLLPSAKHTVVFLSRKIEDEAADRPLCEWKKKALYDFKTWLEDIPDTPPAFEGASADSCDLYTLLSEFTALRQEIRMQNREQNKGINAIETINQAHDKNQEILRTMTDEFFEFEERILEALKKGEETVRSAIETGEKNIRMANEKRTIIPFLDIRDALIRGRSAGEKLIGRKNFFRPAPKGIEGIVEGYEMAIRRFDRALEMVNVHPINASGKTFDPKTMRAVDQRKIYGIKPGIVVEEQLGGFVRGGEVLRTSEVVVSG